MAKIKKVVAADDSVSYVEEDTSLGTDIADAATGTFKLFSSKDDTFYSARVVGMAAMGHLLGGAVVGHKFGDRIPILNAL